MSTKYPIADWADASNIYEVNIRQYSHAGSFRGFQTHLERLKDMNVKILWLMPVTPISEFERLGTMGSYYACSSYTEINPEFGNQQDFRNLVQAAHDLGLKVIIDWVANHTGYRHEWALKNPEWYAHDEDGNFVEKHGWKDVIDLNHNNPEMQQAMIDAMSYWVREFDIDGFRCGMAHLVPLSFWHNARQTCENIKKLFWLGECDEDEYSEVFDVTYPWRWMHATEQFVQNDGSFVKVMHILNHYNGLPQGALKTYFTSNHDENSWNGTEYEKYGKLAIPLAAFTQMLPGIPLVYSGQELPNHKRLKFFEKDIIDWHKVKTPTLHDFYKKLQGLRCTSDAFNKHADVEIIRVGEAGVHINRKHIGAEVIALFNFSNKEILKFQHTFTSSERKYCSLETGIVYEFQEKESFTLYHKEYVIYVKVSS